MQSTFMNIKSQRHSLTFVQSQSDSTFSNFFSYKEKKENADWSQISYLASMSHWNENEFKCSGHMTKNGFQAYMVKTFQNLLLRN